MGKTMKRQFIRAIRNLWIILALGAVCASTAVAGPPKVIRAVPDNGQIDVDPNLREIRITFDQDMARGGFSWVGGGPSYPKTRGKPRWINPRTCVLPVKLEPNHNYWLSINNNRFKNFQSRRGVPAKPYPISFTTGVGTSGGAKTLSGEDNRKAINELQRALKERYSYYDRLGVDWAGLFRKYGRELKGAQSPVSFAKVAAKILAQAKDMHIWLKVGGQRIGTFRRSIKRNYNMATLARVVPQWRKASSCIYQGRYKDGIGYIKITSWSSKDRGALESAFEILDDYIDAKGLIIDVRANGGGSETLAQHFAGCFVEKPVVYAKHVYRSRERPGGFDKPHKRVLRRKKGRPRYRGKVVVLMGQANMSSCEAFLLMMKQVPGCKLIGERSFGSSGNPKPIDLSNGVTVFLPSWKAMRADGSFFEGKGINPDILVKRREENLVDKDYVLEIALEFLRRP